MYHYSPSPGTQRGTYRYRREDHLSVTDHAVVCVDVKVCAMLQLLAEGKLVVALSHI